MLELQRWRMDWWLPRAEVEGKKEGEHIYTDDKITQKSTQGRHTGEMGTVSGS